MLELAYKKGKRVFFINKALNVLKDNICKFNNICSFNARYWIRKIRNNDVAVCCIKSANSNDLLNNMNLLMDETNIYSAFVEKNKKIKKEILNNLYSIYNNELKLKSIFLKLITVKTKNIQPEKTIKVKKLYLCRQCC